MAAHKNKQSTDTLTIRFPKAVVDYVREQARKSDKTLQQYFVEQLSPKSELFLFIMDKERTFLEKSIFDYQARMLTDISSMAESSNIPKEEMMTYLEKGMSLLIRGKSLEEIKNEFEKEQE